MKYNRILYILFFLFCHVSSAMGTTQMSFENRWPFSPAKSIATSDDYVFQALGNVILVIDKADFSNASPVSRIYLNVSEGITNLRYEAPYLFVTTGHHGLSKITISSATISDPAIVSKEPIPAWTESEIEAGITESGTVRDVAISGNRAYVAYTKLNQEEQLYQTGIQVVDISSASTLTLLDAVIVTNDAIASGLASGLTESRRIAISGDYAYIVDTAQGVHVFDISNDTPEFKTIAGFLPTFDISAPGDGFAYTACTAGGIQILDISEYPPVIETVLPIENEDGTTDDVTYFQYNDSTTFARSLQAAGDVTYVADANSGLVTIDTADPTDPRKLGTYSTNLTNSYSVHLDTDNTAYIADYQSGLTKINVSAPAAPALVDSINHGAARTDRFFVNIEGDVFYGYTVDASSSDEGLRILKFEKVSDIYGDLVSNSEFQNVRFQSFLATPGQAQDIDIRHYTIATSSTYSYAFIADGSSGVQIIDVTSKTNPSNTGLATDAAINDARAIDLDSSGIFAFVADGDNGLRILQILSSDKGESYPVYDPELLDTVALPAGGTAKDVLFTSTDSTSGIKYYIYVAAGSAGLQIVEYDPDAKTGTIVGSYDTDGDTKSVEVYDKYAFLADGPNGMVILDISSYQDQEEVNPAPTLMGSIDTPGNATKLWIQPLASNVVYAYVADGDKGIRRIDVSNPTAPVEFDPEITYDTPGYASDIAVNRTDDMVIVGDGSGGITMISVSNPAVAETPDYSYTESPDISSGCFLQAGGL